MTSQEAYHLLCKDVIKEKEDYEKSENRWILHCYYVGEASGRIALKLGLDVEKAKSLGYLHDVGRKVNHYNHPMEGYYYLMDLGYSEEARSCLTHSFIDNDIRLTAGGGPKRKDAYNFINEYLMDHKANIYDNIVQLCDLFCLASGFTTVENRLLDIYSRKGVYQNTEEHLEATYGLKNKIESFMGCDLYSLFPEISREEIKNIYSDKEKLDQIIKENKKEYRVEK